MWDLFSHAALLSETLESGSLWFPPTRPLGTAFYAQGDPPLAFSSVNQTSLGWHHQYVHMKNEVTFARKKSGLFIFPTKFPVSK